MSKPPATAELELFQAACEGARPLAHDQAEPYRRRPPPLPIPQPAHLVETDEAQVGLSESEVETGDFLFFARPGVQNRVLHDLQRGYFEVDIELDLHGLTVEVARRALGEFLQDCAHLRVRCARIIHGKGFGSGERQSVLKCKVNYWLRLRAEVLAFCSASRRDGGTGAVYVLLRNPDKAERERQRG